MCGDSKGDRTVSVQRAVMTAADVQNVQADAQVLARYDIASTIDHTLLIPMATPELVEQWCEAAEKYRFASVCVHPCYVKQAVERLYGSRVKVTTVVGFPLGSSLTAVKLLESQLAVEHGAAELDLKLNLGWFKAGDWDAVHGEIAQIVSETGVPVKAILETTALSDDEKGSLAQLAVDAGAAFLKTSTGWTGGATVADVRLLWEITQGRIPVKASGGIRTPEQAVSLIEAGATRLGTSYGVEIIAQQQELAG